MLDTVSGSLGVPIDGKRIVSKMEVFSRAQYKRLEEANPGELVRFAEGEGSTLAIVTSKSQNETFGYLLLSSTADNFEGPEFTLFEPNDPCLSYGLNWIIELVEDERSVPRSRAGVDQLGVIRLLAEGPAMIVRGAQPNDRKRLGLFNLQTGKFVGRERHEGAPCFAWTIWADATDMHRPGARPIAIFP
ncbi:hypothetical protein [Mesorhizobium cantuariense]|uniref:Uncharacterized protein n=1 Tax=Mesorhizobium cantuariense TaxID=1300275 RepID=A0ABV7MN96_9HYPH